MKISIALFLILINNHCTTLNDNEDSMQSEIIELVESNKINEVKLAIKNGADVNSKNKNNKSILLIATENKFKDLAIFLTESGANVNAQADNLDTPFLYAGASGQTELVKLYLANGARFDIFNRYNGTALIPACERGHVETVRVLASTENYPIDHVNRLGWTALMEAVVLGNGSEKFQQIIKILIDNGADRNITDGNGVTALEHAKNKKQTKIAEILASYKF